MPSTPNPNPETATSRFFELRFVTRISLVFGALGLLTLIATMVYSVRSAQNNLDAEIYNRLQQQHRTLYAQFESRLTLLDVYLQSASANRLYVSIDSAGADSQDDSMLEEMAFMFQDSVLGNNIDIFFVADSQNNVLLDAGSPLYPIDSWLPVMRPPLHYSNRWTMLHTDTDAVMIKSTPLFDPATLQLRGYLVIGFAIGANRTFLSSTAEQAGVDLVKLGIGTEELLRYSTNDFTGVRANRGENDTVTQVEGMYLLSRPLPLGRNTEALWVAVGISSNQFSSVFDQHRRSFFLLSGGFLVFLAMATWLVHLSHSRSINGLLRYISSARVGSRQVTFEPSGILEYNRVGYAMQEMVRDLNVAATVFQSAQGMVVTDEQTRILRVNNAFQSITGFTTLDLVGRPLNLIQADRHKEDINSQIEQALQEQGSWQGEAWGKRKNGEHYLQWMSITAVYSTDQTSIQNYVVTLIDMTDRKAAEQKIEHLAFFDQLTGLPNRQLLLDHLSNLITNMQSNPQCGAVMYIDLDDFKTLNDTKGHDVGDAFLQQVAERLSQCVRHSDLVARLGGDEFVILLENLADTADKAEQRAQALAEKILARFSVPFTVSETDHFSTLSIGVTLFGQQASTVEELLKQSDLAMYQAKAAGRNTYRFFNPEMQQRVISYQNMAKEIRVALKERQFELFLQPQVDAKKATVGAETLLRWNHPERGLVSPKEVITVAEDTGLILPLGHWVLERSCQILAAWQGNPSLEALTLSVNISARQLYQNDFVERVLAVLKRTGAPPHRLKLELTESMLLEDIKDTIAKMHRLREHGIGFSLDDFGTGYSSLSYLKQLPLDQLKIDRSFVDDLMSKTEGADIAKTIVALANGLSITSLAEGVESEDQYKKLLAFGCQGYQGYYFGRPMPLKEFESLPCHH